MAIQHIYLVEDSPLLTERLIELLDAVPGALVMGVASGADEAIADILLERPDMVLLDLQLAQGSGYDVLKALGAAAPEIDVFMMSSFAAEPYRRIAARLGARDFFDKGTDLRRVRDLVAARVAATH